MPEMRMLAGRYQLVEAAGRGSMGTVWRARDQLLNRQVAVKEVRLPPGLTQEQRSELTERTMREARTAAQVSHQAVITVFDVVAEDGRPWIIMEFVDARSLEEIVDQEGPLTPRMASELGYDLLSALRAAHKHGVLHRDVKPSNVLITDKGRVVLTDFGIAKQQTDATLTRTGMVIGSPGYTAPERARGEHTGPESDLWSLGATLYYAVEGRPAYERESVMATISALLTEDVDPPKQAGPLAPILEGLLAKDPKERIKPEHASATLRKIAKPHEPEEAEETAEDTQEAEEVREAGSEEAEKDTNPREREARTAGPARKPPPGRPKQPARSPGQFRPPDPERTVALPWLSKPAEGSSGSSVSSQRSQTRPPQAGRPQTRPAQSQRPQPPQTSARRPRTQQPQDNAQTVAIEGRSAGAQSGAPAARDGLMTGVFGIARPPAPAGGTPARRDGLSRSSRIIIVGSVIVILAIILGFILLISRG